MRLAALKGQVSLQGIAALILVAPAIVAPIFGKSSSSVAPKEAASSDIELTMSSQQTSRSGPLFFE